MRQRALIFKLGQIGDVIMSIPAARALYEQGYTIEWVCGQAVQPLLECYSWIHLFPVNDRALLRGSLADRVRAILLLWRHFSRVRYALCATLYYDRRYRLLTWPVRARRKVSLARSMRERTLLPGRRHPDEYLRIMLGLEDSCRNLSSLLVRPDNLPASSESRPHEGRRVGIVPGGTSNLLRQQVLRRWPVENYATLAQRLLDRGWEVVLLGGPEDTWVRPHFGHLAVIDRISELSLPQVLRACDECDAVVSHDTGPLHLAGMSEACLVGIFGPTDPSTFLPRRPYVVGIWGGQGFACRPCYDGRDFAPCQHNGCMHQVTPELVLRELDRLLDERARKMNSAWRIVVPDTDPTLVSLTTGSRA